MSREFTGFADREMGEVSDYFAGLKLPEYDLTGRLHFFYGGPLDVPGFPFRNLLYRFSDQYAYIEIDRENHRKIRIAELLVGKGFAGFKGLASLNLFPLFSESFEEQIQFENAILEKLKAKYSSGRRGTRVHSPFTSFNIDYAEVQSLKYLPFEEDLGIIVGSGHFTRDDILNLRRMTDKEIWRGL